MNRLFDADFHKFPFSASYGSLILSPNDSRVKILHVLESAKTSIQIFSMSLSDETMIELLKRKSAQGVSVEVCLAYENTKERTNLKRSMKDAKIVFKQAKSPYVHAKTILVDDDTLIIGSMNFTENSIDQNRETSLELGNSSFFKPYKERTKADCRDVS